MARGLPSNRVAVVCSASLLLLGLAVASVPPPSPQQQEQPQACKGTGGCPAAAETVTDEFSEGLSLLMMGGSAARARDRDVDRASDYTEGHAAKKAEDGTAGATGSNILPPQCNEENYKGLCYRTCTDMGAMEPRNSPSNCGGEESYNFIQSCNEDGSSTIGSGSAPSIMGRPQMGCFGDPTANDESEYPPNLCTWDCKHGAPSTKHDAVKFEGKKPVCCTDGTSTPTAAVMEDDFLCYCSLGIKPAFVWLPEPMGVLKMPKHKPCNTVCSKSKSWLMNDGIAYCCPKDAKPTVKRVLAGSDYSIECSCP